MMHVKYLMYYYKSGQFGIKYSFFVDVVNN